MNHRPDDAYLAELLRERWGNHIPWREATAKPGAPPINPCEPDNDITRARRRRLLNEALDDAPQHYRRWQRTA
jgi:hypothetical protein